MKDAVKHDRLSTNWRRTSEGVANSGDWVSASFLSDSVEFYLYGQLVETG
jgi:hypothetical protein